MKVGIVSLFGVFNYGNRLQNYAVQEVLEKLGCNTEVIYIQPWRICLREMAKKLYFSFALQYFLKLSNKMVRKFQRQKAFEHFNESYINTKRYFSVKHIKDADFFVLGSDQVWNPKRYDSIKKELFFLTFTDSSKKVCFSPSFGTSEIPEQWKLYFKKQLLTFPHISVRESSGVAIVKELTGEEAKVLVDPTLMIDKDEWERLEKNPKKVNTKSEYVLNYFLGDVPEKATVKGEKIAKEIHGNVYNLLDPESDGLYTSGPSEFLYLIDHASLIQTDSFHACIFSFIFGKPFLLYAREGKDDDMFSRMETLFTTFDLMRKYVDSGLENDVFECNYEVGYRRLTDERVKVINFLKESMNLSD